MQRYWDFSIPSAEVKPTNISKVSAAASSDQLLTPSQYNTFLQLLLMGATTISPLVPYNVNFMLQALQWTVGGTTIASALSYIRNKNAVRYIK